MASQLETGEPTSFALLVPLKGRSTELRVRRLFHGSCDYVHLGAGTALSRSAASDPLTGDDVLLGRSVDDVAHVIQVALTPVFLLSGIASLLGVFSTRLARVADRVHLFAEKIEGAPPRQRADLQRRLQYLRRRSHILDAAVIMTAVAGGATCLAALLLFVSTLRNQAVVTFLFGSFGFALLCTVAALALFLTEMLMASRGIRDQVDTANGDTDAKRLTREI